MPAITLKNNGPNANTVKIGAVSVVFSYESAIGYYIHGRDSVLNPDFVGFSPTTSAHATQAGLKGAPMAESGAKFATDLVALIAAQI